MALQLYVQPRGGEFIAQGIMSAAQSVASGIDRYYKRKEENERMDQATDFFQRTAKANPEMAKMLNITDPNDTGAIKAGIKAAGGADKFMQMASITQNMMLQKAQNDRANADAARQAREGYAAQDAMDQIMALANRQITPEQYVSGEPVTANQFLQRAVSNGANVQKIAPLYNAMSDAETARAKANRPAFAPSMGTVRNPTTGELESFFTTSDNSAQLVPKPKPEPGIKEGEERTLKVPAPDGSYIDVNAIWLRGAFRDKESGAEIYSKYDPMAMRTMGTSVNPSILQRYGKNAEEDPYAAPKGKLTLGKDWSVR